jgi:hypothetical protein
MASIFDIFQEPEKLTLHYQTPDKQTIIPIDAVISENTRFPSEATKHETENGSIMTDHIIKQPKTISIDGVVSDDPITLEALGIGVSIGLLGSTIKEDTTIVPAIIAGKLGADIINSSAGSRRSTKAKDALEEIYETKSLISIVSATSTFINMVMISLDINKSPNNRNSLQFTSTFQEILIASSETVLIADNAKSEDVQASDANITDLGKQATKPASPEVSAQARDSLFIKTIELFSTLPSPF